LYLDDTETVTVEFKLANSQPADNISFMKLNFFNKPPHREVKSGRCYTVYDPIQTSLEFILYIIIDPYKTKRKYSIVFFASEDV